MDWTHVLVAVIAGALASVPALYQSWRARRKLDAETQKVGAEAATVLVTAALDMVQKQERRVECVEAELKTLRQRIEELTMRVRVLEDENEELWEGAAKLANQVMELDEVPVWLPGEQRPAGGT